ncbi:MAG: hypothetical protein KC413_08710, partial [Anaerolineales bacterium]|nr:hypothetical protein [Anaerolineales bacterium]
MIVHLYRVAYAYAPGEFFIQYKVVSKGTNKLKDATVKTAKPLMTNATVDLKALARSDSMIRDLTTKFLITKWALLSDDYRIKEQPGSRRVREAWQFIDQTVKPGNTETKLADALFPLFNPPFGYDYNTALLLFSAWFGYHRLDLEVYINGSRVQQQSLVNFVDRGSKDFFQNIATNTVVSLSRRAVPDKAQIKARIQIAETHQFLLKDAQSEVVWLKETAEDDRHGPDLCASARQAASNLEQAVDIAIQYDREANQIREQISQANTAKELISLQKKIGKLPTLGNVQAQADTPEILGQQIEQRFTAVVETICQENESPEQITQIGLNRTRLLDEKKAIANAGLPILTQRIDQSLTRLEQREKDLKAALQEEELERNLLNIINGVDPRSRLQQLRNGLTTLNELGNLSRKLATQRDTRLQQVEKAIADILAQISKSHRDLENVNQQAQLQPIRDRLISLQPRCADTEEAKEITALLNQIEEIRGRLIAQEQHHTELKQAILRVKDDAPLLELTEGRTQLQELVDLPVDLAQLRENRGRALEKAVSVIHSQIEQAENTLANAQTTKQLRNVQETLYGLKQRCAETPEAERVEALLERWQIRQEELAQAERHADEIRRILDAADPKATLKRLIEAQQQVNELSNVPDNLIKERDQRLAQLEQAISTIRDQIEGARADLTAASNRNAISETRDALLKLQARCVDTPEEEEITQLISRTDQLRDEFEEQERRKRAWRETINSVRGNSHRLQELYNGQATLHALTDLPDDLKRARDARLQEIEKSINDIQQHVERASHSLDAATDPGQLQKQRDELIKLRHRCEDTPLERVVNQHVERADALKHFMEQIEKERKPEVDTPGASQEQIKRLEQLG